MNKPKIKKLYSKISRFLLFIFLLITEIAHTKDIQYQANACYQYQSDQTLIGIKKQIINDCKKQFKDINNKIKVIDSRYEQLKHRHKLVLKLLMENKSLVDFNVDLSVNDECNITYNSCNKACSNSGIKEFSCKENSCICD